MADVFISYAREDRARAEHVARGLAALGLQAFWDTEIPPGQTWADYIEGKLNQCRAVVVLWSANSTKSQWVREEARMGRDKAKLIPALLDNSQAPFGFGEVQAADLSTWNGDPNHPEWRRFAGAVQNAVGAPTQAAPQPPPQAIPPQAQPQPAAAPWTAAPVQAAAPSSAALSPIGYVQKCFRLYADGKGRARRSEYGWLIVATFVIGFVTGVLDATLTGVDPYTGMANGYYLTLIAMLALIAPCVAVASRRAHDIGQSGWFAVLTVVPYIGFLAVLAFIFIPGRSGANQYGPDPKA